jgi:hypothetical protein
MRSPRQRPGYEFSRFGVSSGTVVERREKRNERDLLESSGDNGFQNPTAYKDVCSSGNMFYSNRFAWTTIR